jgi:SulP family sulfate permease
VEAGVSAGVILSIGLHLYKTSRPHVAVVGLVPGTQHFRNIKRHRSRPTNRADAAGRREPLFRQCALSWKTSSTTWWPSVPVRHVVLMCPAVNEIDMSALESLEAINERLQHGRQASTQSEVKGPVMDRLKRGDFLHI